MRISISVLFIVLFISSFLSAAEGVSSGKEKFLTIKSNAPKTSVTEVLEQDEIESVAVRLENEKERRKQEKLVRKEQARLESIERMRQKQINKMLKKSDAKKRAFLRKAAELENRRKIRITAWRNYMSKKKAAKCLIKEVKKVDRGNNFHVSQLQDEIKAFAQIRMKGNLKPYPELESFLP